MRRSPFRHLWLTPFVLLAAVYFRPVLAQINQVVVGAPLTRFADAMTQSYPWRTFAQVEMQQGRLPLWNPFILCGYPSLAEGPTGIFYPLNVLFTPLSSPVAVNLFALVHFAAAGIFFSLYLRACGLHRFSAFFGGFVYMFSSAPISRFFAGHYSLIPFLALVPALMWVWESWRTTGGWEKACGGGVILGSLILAGYPQLVLFSCLYLGWQVVGEMASLLRQQRGKTALLPLWFFAVVVVLGAGIGAVQLFPSYVFAQESFRGQVAYDTLTIFSFSPENLLTLLLPRFFGNMGEGIVPYWGRHLLWENWIYIGIVPLALSVLALVRVRKPLVTVHGLAIPLFFVLALGKHTPLHRLLYDHVPFFNYFRGSAKFSYFVLFSLTALAASGADHLLHEADPAKRRVSRFTIAGTLAVFAALGIGLGLILGIAPMADGSALSRFVQWRLAQGETYLPFDFYDHPDLRLIWDQARPQLVRLASISLAGLLVALLWPVLRRKYWLACVALGLVVSPEMLQFSTMESIKAPIDTYAVAPAFLRELRKDPVHTRVLAPASARNTFLPYRVASPLGDVVNVSRRYNGFLTAVNGVPRSTSMVESPVMRLTPLSFWPAVSHLVLPDGDRPPVDVATPIEQDSGQVLYRLLEVHPRVAFSRSAKFHASSEGALADLENGSIDLSTTDLLEVPEGATRPRFEPPVPGDRVDILESLPMRTVIRTRAGGARLLVLADSFDTGWRCRLEAGTELEIYPVNLAFRGVVVPSGEHTVTFSYQPASFAVGAAISILAVIGIAVGAVLLSVQRKRGMRFP